MADFLIDTFLNYEIIIARMKNADCKMAALAGTPRCPVFSAFHTPHSAIRNPLVASAPAKWLLKILKLRIKPIFEPTRVSLQLVMNKNVISDFEPCFYRHCRKNKPI